jgi:hypothetical protein
MKNATLLLSVLVGAMLTGCAGVSPTRIIGNTVAAAGGAFIGNKLSDGNPLIIRYEPCICLRHTVSSIRALQSFSIHRRFNDAHGMSM